MRLKEITAKNYRTLQDIRIPFSPYYCTLSGRNNAGKSCVIRLLCYLMEPARRPWQPDAYGLDYDDDRTQWKSNEDHIVVVWTILLSSSDDPALQAYLETISDQKIKADEVELVVTVEVDSRSVQTQVSVDGKALDKVTSKEVVDKLRNLNCLFLHNSAEEQNPFVYAGRGRRRSYYELLLSEQEQRTLRDAARTVQRKTRQLIKGHRDVLRDLLGKLTDTYDVEFRTFEGYGAQDMPLGINLKDKKVDVPIGDWGSGTQNRTYILMSLLQAKRMKDVVGSDEKITPIVVVEEPESFLHPAAQAEFGALLQDLAQELGIQIVVSTHSPFMLNRVSPSSNILMRRRLHRKQLQETEIVDTSGDDWMEPFSEHLGIVSPEFRYWRPVLSSSDSRVLLVEGDIDKEYFTYVRTLVGERCGVPDDVEIVPYGGKDALKNTVLVGFVLRSFDKVFVTFDLDSAGDVRSSLKRLGLQERKDFLAIGRNRPGKSAIEGLLPEKVISTVFARETALAMQLTSQSNAERREAKAKLKRLLLEEFKKQDTYSDSELKGFLDMGSAFRRAFR